MITIPFDTGFIYFILFAPVIGFGLSFIIQIIIGISNSSKSTKTYKSNPSSTKSQMRDSSPYHIPYDIPTEDYETKRRQISNNITWTKLFCKGYFNRI